MSSLPCSTADDASALRDYVTTYASHPNQLLWNGKVFISTFSGESCTFGQGSVAAGWQNEFINQLTGANTVQFVPSFFVAPNTFTNYNGVMDGYFNVSHRTFARDSDPLISHPIVERWLADFLDRVNRSVPAREQCRRFEQRHVLSFR